MESWNLNYINVDTNVMAVIKLQEQSGEKISILQRNCRRPDLVHTLKQESIISWGKRKLNLAMFTFELFSQETSKSRSNLEWRQGEDEEQQYTGCPQKKTLRQSQFGSKFCSFPKDCVFGLPVKCTYSIYLAA